MIYITTYWLPVVVYIYSGNLIIIQIVSKWIKTSNYEDLIYKKGHNWTYDSPNECVLCMQPATLPVPQSRIATTISAATGTSFFVHQLHPRAEISNSIAFYLRDTHIAL